MERTFRDGLLVTCLAICACHHPFPLDPVDAHAPADDLEFWTAVEQQPILTMATALQGFAFANPAADLGSTFEDQWHWAVGRRWIEPSATMNANTPANIGFLAVATLDLLESTRWTRHPTTGTQALVAVLESWWRTASCRHARRIKPSVVSSFSTGWDDSARHEVKTQEPLREKLCGSYVSSSLVYWVRMFVPRIPHPLQPLHRRPQSQRQHQIPRQPLRRIRNPTIHQS